MANQDRALRTQLVELLRGGSAHVSLASALEDIPANLYGVRPNQSPHSAWELLEHMRIALHDLLEFCTNPDYLAPTWPDDYWPKSSAPPSEGTWRASVEALQEDLKAFEDLIQDPESNLYAEIPWADDHQTLLREVLVAGDHNSYHTGELVLLLRMLDAWKA